MLVGIAGRRCAPVSSARLATHVMRLHGGDGWPVQRGAFEALMLRVESANRRQLRIARMSKAPGAATASASSSTRGLLGVYRTRLKGSGEALPSRTALLSIAPLVASCDCRDFLLNGLGFCAHVFAALTHVESGPRRRKRAEEALPLRFALDWDPTRPVLDASPGWSRLRFASPGRAPAFVSDWPMSEDGVRTPGALSESGAASMLRAAAAYAKRAPHRVSPAARAMLGRAAPREPSPNTASPEAHLATLLRPLYRYQREGVERFLRDERLLLADDMGLGKTAQAIAGAHALFHSGQAERGLFIVPAALKSQWEREWHLFSDTPVTVVEGSPAARRALYRRTKRGFLILNYELLLRDGQALGDFDADLVVLDEAQRIKNPATKTARAVRSLEPRYRLALSGTPLENRLSELASVLGWVDERVLEPAWRIPIVHGGVGAAVNLCALRARVSRCLLRRTRAEILGQLPPRSDTVVPVELSAMQRDPHETFARKVRRLASVLRYRRLTPAEQLDMLRWLTLQRIVANALAQLRFDTFWPEIETAAPTDEMLATLGAPKLAALREVIRSLVVEQGRTIVVFSQWRRMLQLAHWATRDLLEAQGLRSVFFTGRESPRKRDRSVVELHDDPRTRVLFSSDAGGVGLNLQRAASACVNLELPWNPAVLEQRVARIHRMGQDRPIDVLNLVTRDSIEGRIEHLVGAKQALFTGLFDSDEDSVHFDGSSLLERLVEGDEAQPPSAAVAALIDEERDQEAGEPETPSPSRVVEPVEPAPEASEEPDAEPAAERAAVEPAIEPAVEPAIEPALEPAAEPELTPRSGERDAAMAELLGALTIAARADGGVHIEAPPAVAAQLAALLRGLASQIESPARPAEAA